MTERGPTYTLTSSSGLLLLCRRASAPRELPAAAAARTPPPCRLLFCPCSAWPSLMTRSRTGIPICNILNSLQKPKADGKQQGGLEKLLITADALLPSGLSGHLCYSAPGTRLIKCGVPDRRGLRLPGLRNIQHLSGS